jgi:hypothetical protein
MSIPRIGLVAPVALTGSTGTKPTLLPEASVVSPCDSGIATLPVGVPEVPENAMYCITGVDPRVNITTPALVSAPVLSLLRSITKNRFNPALVVAGAQTRTMLLVVPDPHDVTFVPVVAAALD